MKKDIFWVDFFVKAIVFWVDFFVKMLFFGVDFFIVLKKILFLRLIIK